jgi:hypothetical protein
MSQNRRARYVQCLVGYVRLEGQICSGKLDLVLQKSRSGVQTMGLGPDKLTTSKLDNIEVEK